MKKQYIFSKAEKGKFYNPDLIMNVTIYLDPEFKEFIEELARKKNTNIQELVHIIIINYILIYRSQKKIDN